MGRVPYFEFVGSRARFQRLSDQRVFAGWLQSLRHDNATVIAEESLSFDMSERFLFQVQGPSADAYFIATSTGLPAATATYVRGSTAKQLVELPAMNYEFGLITQIQLRDSQQQSRKVIETMVATVHGGGRLSEVLITDASRDGMGVIAWEELKKGDMVQVEIRNKSNQVSMTCEVKHCRPEERLIGAYRVGLHVEKADRLSVVAWRKMVNPA